VPVEVLPSSWQVLGTDVLAGTETVTVSDTTSSDGPEVVYDNDTSAQWQSANGTSGKYWQVDLGSGQEQAVERVNLMSANDMNGDSAHNITSLQVKGSVDSSTWVTLADVDPSSWALNQMHTIDFSNDTAYRHYRLEKAAGGASGGLNLKEVELLARNATATDFGTNGFHLDFADGADLGNDVGSNNNDFTTTNLDATDQTLDSPTRNFATFDAADGHSDIVLSGGNLIVDSTSAYGHNRAIKASTSVSTGKYYWEVKIANGAINGSRSIGIIDATHSLTGSTDYLGGLSNAIALDASQGTVRSSDTPIAYLGTSLSVGDVVGVVVDMDAQKLWFSVNGSYVNNGDPETGANPVDTASLGFTWPASIAPAASTQSTRELHFNFGATDLLYKPAGFGTLESVTIEGTTFGDPIETPTEGNDSIEGTLEADVIDGLGGDDKLIGNGGVDTLSGNDGDDLLIGGEGDDTLSGGAGDDTASYADNISGYTVSYDSATDTITVTDTDTSNGDEGTDTITGVESFDFNSTTLTKADLEAAPIATDSAAQVATDGVADWTLTGSGGSGTLTYAIEGLAASTDGAHLAANGWYETAMGNFVRVTDAATGDYEYDAVNGYEGADSFDFRVTDDATGVSSVATVDVGVGFPGYAIEHSVSFDAAEGESLSRTPAGAGDRKAWTYSFWLKGDVSGSTSQKVLSVGPDSSNRFNVYFADNKMGVYQQASGSTQLDAVSDTLPDNSNGTAWHHYVVSVDTAAATGAERVRIYKDGNLVGFDSGYPNTYIGQNVDTFVNGTEKHRIGVQYDDTNQHLDSDLAEVVLIDGQALDALAFGEFDANGDWVAKAVDPSTWMAPEDVTSSVDAVNTSASMSDPDSDVAHLTDGNATTKWSSLNGSSGQYFEFDFGAGDERAIEQIYIDFRQDNSSGYLDSLDIKASNDGVTYTTVSTVTNPGWAEGENVTLEFANSTAYRYWRVEKASGASNTNLNIYEAKMYVMGPATDLGTNGFHLDFADGANLGDDAAGSNDFTTTNLDATDQTLDSPTDNYATLDPNGVLLGSGGTLSDGNLSWEGGWTGTQEVVGTIAIPSSGSFYMEGRITTAGSTPRSTYFGFLDADRGPNFSHGILSRADTAALSGSVKVLDGAESTDGPYASWRSTDVDIGMLYDVDNDVVKAYVDGVLQWTQENASTYLTGNTILPYVVGGDGTVFTVDFGQNGFNETIPAGATPLSSAHIDGTTYGEPLVTPTSGNDSIEGTSDADVIDGLAGDDKPTGNEGGDTLTGNEGDDQLIGNAGDDTLSGGSGDDTYSFGRGDDADLIDNIGEGASADTVKFGATIDTDQLWFRQDGNDLVVDVIGTADSVTIDEWYASADNRVDTFETADGSTLDDANVQNLVSAMASFSPPALGETELSQALHDSLDPVIAANWQSGGS